MIKKLTYLIIITLLPLFGMSQSPSDYFDINHFNKKYLEHLIKVGIDSVRTAHECEKLVNDSILYVAATDQSGYMKKNRRLSHYQNGNKEKRTPQDRANFYGANHYRVGENVAFVPLLSGNEDQQHKSSTYQSIAQDLVTAWVKSPGHFNNIITEEYEVTGVAISVDLQQDKVYGCQKFAHIELKHRFIENQSFFPYSNYTPPSPIRSFNNIPKELIPKYKYPHKLRHDNLEICKSCPDRNALQPDISLNYDPRKGYILRVENSKFVRDIIRNRQDGFAVEVVSYDDYACGNNAYYSKPSRRNGQLRTNGKIIEPKYRKELLRGFKKRKLKKDIKFFPYIFRKDSINFFKRFGKYNVDKYTSEYFEINLGRLPRNTGPIINSNLLVIKDRKICDVYYFTSYCGELYEEYKETEFIPYVSDVDSYGFVLIDDQVSYTVPFEQGKTEFKHEQILEPIKSLSNYDFVIDSIHVNAFSSVEGSEEINERLQLERGRNIANIFQGIQDKEITKRIKTSVNWTDFRERLAGDTSLSKELRQPNIQLKLAVDEDPGKFSDHLDATRKGNVKVHFHVIPNVKSVDYYVKHEWERLSKEIKRKYRQHIDPEQEVQQMVKLYKYVHWLIHQNLVSSDIFHHLPFPNAGYKNPEFTQLNVLFGEEFPEEIKCFQWRQDSTMITDQLLASTEIQLLKPFEYHKMRILTNKFTKNGGYDEKLAEQLKMVGQNLESYYQENDKARINIDKANFNLNMSLVNTFYNGDPSAFQKNAVNSINQLLNLYTKQGEMADTVAFKLAKMMTWYRNVNYAMNILNPYKNSSNEIMAYIDVSSYNHPSQPFSEFFYQKVIQDFNSLPRTVWCSMFLKPCGIPFQAFDNEELRTLFCNECQGENDFLNEMYQQK